MRGNFLFFFPYHAEGGVMKQFAQFTVAFLLGMFAWTLYNLVNMAIEDGLKMVGIENLYLQGLIVIAIILAVVFGVFHLGLRKVLESLE